MTISEALRANKGVRREAWDQDKFVKRVDEGRMEMTVREGASLFMTLWNPTAEDLTAKDWVVI